MRSVAQRFCELPVEVSADTPKFRRQIYRIYIHPIFQAPAFPTSNLEIGNGRQKTTRSARNFFWSLQSVKAAKRDAYFIGAGIGQVKQGEGQCWKPAPDRELERNRLGRKVDSDIWLANRRSIPRLRMGSY